MDSSRLKEFIDRFDFCCPDWSNLPTNFPRCDLDDLSPEEISRFLAIQSYWELAKPRESIARSRVWQSTEGYIYLVPWSNASLLRILGRRFTDTLPRREYRLKAQPDDCLRSTVANIEEGFAQATTRRYLDFLGFSQGSLKEGKGDLQRSRQDGFLKSIPGSSLMSIEIDLSDWHEALKRSVISHQNPINPNKNNGSDRNLKDIGGNYARQDSGSLLTLPVVFKFDYPPVDDLDTGNLTYEILLELTNKTDWHLRKLVESLEKKLDREQKYYQVEKARIRSRLG